MAECGGGAPSEGVSEKKRRPSLYRLKKGDQPCIDGLKVVGGKEHYAGQQLLERRGYMEHRACFTFSRGRK